MRSWRPPGYPFYLSLFYLIGGIDGFNLVPYVNFIIYLLSFYLLFSLSNFFFRQVDSYCIVLVVYLFHSNKFNQLIVVNYSESLFFFLSTCFLFLFVKSIKQNNKFYFIFSFFILGISYMVRGPSLPLGIVIFLFLFLFQKKFSTKIIFTSLTIFLLPCIIWIIRNYYVLGFGPHLYTANYILIYYGLFDYLEAHKIDALVRGLDDLGKVTKLKSLIIEKISSDYLGTVIIFLKKFLRIFYYHNTYISSFLLIILLIQAYNKNRKEFTNYLNSKIEKIFFTYFFICILYFFISCLAQSSWRYSLIPSIYKQLFEIFLILNLIKTNKNVSLQKNKH